MTTSEGYRSYSLQRTLVALASRATVVRWNPAGDGAIAPSPAEPFAQSLLPVTAIQLAG